MELKEKLFATGFNSGYILAEFEPHTLDKILKDIQTITPFIDGLKRGQIQFQQELIQNRINAIHQLKGNNLEHDRDHD